MFKINNIGLTIFIVLFAFMPFLMATTVTHNETGLKFEIPDDWSYEQEDNHFVAISPDESVILYFYVGKFEDVSDLMDNIADQLDGIIESPEIEGEPIEEKINDLTQVYIEGSGYIKGKTIDFDLTIVIGGAKPMLIIALGDIESMQETILDIYASVQK